MELITYLKNKMIEHADISDNDNYSYIDIGFMQELILLREKHGDKITDILTDLVLENAGKKYAGKKYAGKKYAGKKYASTRLVIEFLGIIDAKDALVKILDESTEFLSRSYAVKFLAKNHLNILESRYQTEQDDLIFEQMRDLLMVNECQLPGWSKMHWPVCKRKGLRERFNMVVNQHGKQTAMTTLEKLSESKYYGRKPHVC